MAAFCNADYPLDRLDWISTWLINAMDQVHIKRKQRGREVIRRVRAMSVILGLAFLALGILGLTGIMPMFTSGLVYVNIGQIVLGALGLAVGIYARPSGDYRLKRENDRLRRKPARFLTNDEGRFHKETNSGEERPVLYIRPKGAGS